MKTWIKKVSDLELGKNIFLRKKNIAFYAKKFLVFNETKVIFFLPSSKSGTFFWRRKELIKTSFIIIGNGKKKKN